MRRCPPEFLALPVVNSMRPRYSASGQRRRRARKSCSTSRRKSAGFVCALAVVTVSETLKLELIVTNNSTTDEFVFENCLHTYFEVGDIRAVSIKGLGETTYLDKVANFAQKTETDEAIRIASEVDRIYVNTSAPVEILDARLSRKIVIQKQSSLSTVVWNPWIAKAQQVPDFGNEEYERMVCVESGNVSPNQLRLPPGQSSRLTVELSSSPLR